MSEFISQRTRVTVEQSSKGIGFLGLLTIVFVIAKLTGVIDWGWLMVFIPIWIIPAICIGIGLVILVVWLVLELASHYGAARRRKARAAEAFKRGS